MDTSTTPVSNSYKVFGIISLVLGILAFLFSFIPCLGSYALFPGVIGIVLGIVGFVQAGKVKASKGIVIAGIVLSLLGSIIAGYQLRAMGKAVSAIDETIKKDSTDMNQLKGSLDSLKNNVDSTLAADTTGSAK
jgi:hypothetical protein